MINQDLVMKLAADSGLVYNLDIELKDSSGNSIRGFQKHAFPHHRKSIYDFVEKILENRDKIVIENLPMQG